MSSQGWAAAAQGLGHGFQYAKEQQQKALENAAKQRLLDLQGQELAMKADAAAADKIKTKVALEASGYDPQGNMLPGFANPGELAVDAKARREREAKQVQVPDISGIALGSGPTPMGSASGLGALNTASGKETGLSQLLPYSGMRMDPEIAKSVLPQQKEDWVSKILFSDALKNNPNSLAQQNANRTNQRLEEAESARRTEKQAAAVENIIGKNIAPLSLRLKSLRQKFDFLNDNPDSSAMPGRAARFAQSKIPLVGGYIAEGLSTDEQSKNYQDAKDILSEVRHARYGSALTGTEQLESELDSGILARDATRIANALNKISNIVDNRVSSVGAAYPLGVKQLEEYGNPLSNYIVGDKKAKSAPPLPPPQAPSMKLTGKEPAGMVIDLGGKKVVSLGNGQYEDAP